MDFRAVSRFECHAIKGLSLFILSQVLHCLRFMGFCVHSIFCT